MRGGSFLQVLGLSQELILTFYDYIYAIYFVLSDTFKWILSAFLEPRLKISRPAKVVPIELLMSVNSESFFALARPVQDPC